MNHLKFCIYLVTILSALFAAAWLNYFAHYFAAVLMLAIAFVMLSVKDVRDTLERRSEGIEAEGANMDE